MVLAKSGKRRIIHFSKEQQLTTEENIENMALAVRELTGDWVTMISCEDILALDRHHYDQIVYFGQPSDL